MEAEFPPSEKFSDMAIEIVKVERTDARLEEACRRLMPQLSSRIVFDAERLRRVVESEQALLLAACDGERIAGLLTLVWYDAPSERKAWIEDVVVDEAARGLGAGRALVAEALREAVRAGASRVMLTSAPARKAARALYRKMGFEEAETSVFVHNTVRIWENS